MTHRIVVNPAARLDNGFVRQVAFARARHLLSGDQKSDSLTVRGENEFPQIGKLNFDTVYAGRNTIFRAGDLAVKIFCTNLTRRILYSFRSTKARRSYRNALTLLDRGIDTPMPVAYTESRSAVGLLLDCRYVCAYISSKSLDDLFESGNERFISDFASFMARLHEAGIRHDDLNSTNIRVRTADDGSYSFSLIDLNRMKIYPEGTPVPLDECFRNFVRFSSLTPAFRRFVALYLRARGLDPALADRAIAVKEADNRRVDRKKRFKRLIHRK